MKYIYQISFSTKERQKRLEDYFFEVTGKRPNFGPIQYGGSVTIVMVTEDLKDYSFNNVTGAIYFPGKRFRSVDDFIKWHRVYKNLCCSFNSKDTNILMQNISLNLEKEKTYNDYFTDLKLTFEHGSRYLYRCNKCGKYVLVQHRRDKASNDYVTEYIPVLDKDEADRLVKKYTPEKLMEKHKNKMFSICIKDYNWI